LPDPQNPSLFFFTGKMLRNARQIGAFSLSKLSPSEFLRFTLYFSLFSRARNWRLVRMGLRPPPFLEKLRLARESGFALAQCDIVAPV
jgi:hypothetical protein